MFIDASAIVSILTNEPGAGTLAQSIESTANPITSPVAVFEATLGIRRKFDLTVERAELNVSRFLAAAGVEIVPIAGKDAETALEAFRRFGKGQGHPAQLNMGDCFAYAVARNRGRLLLYTGDGFSKTDIDGG
jgi:ribonuclease VapC